MRNIFKFLMMGLMMIAFAAGAATTTFAQDPAAEQQAVYQKFLDNRKGPGVDKFKIAIAAGEEYLQKYGADEANKEIVAYINKLLPQLKKAVGGLEDSNRFNTSVPAKNWDDAFASGKELLAQSPDNIDVMLVLASIGFDNATATPPVDKYNADAVNYAKAAIQKINENKPSGTGNYGAFDYVYKNNKYADGKNNALGWMNYTIGKIMFDRMNQKKEALPYLYKATQTPGFIKDSPDVYVLIGSYYRDEYNRIVADRAAKIKANGDKETPETRDALGMQYAYADRAINAYALAYKTANANPEVKEPYKKGLMDTSKLFYKARFEKDDGSDAYIATESAKPLIDPTTEVAPVAVEKLETPITETPATTGTPTASPTTSPSTTATPTTSPSASPKPTPSASPKKP